VKTGIATSETTFRQLWRNFPLRTGHVFFDVMLLAIPVALVLDFVLHTQPIWIFIAAAVAILPLAAALGEATEELAAHMGQRIGGLLNATLGNATELIIAFFALRAGHVEIVKASLSGSIIGNTLLVLGAAVLVGGIGRERQTFSRRDAGVNSTMLFIAVVALVMPAMFDLAVYGRLEQTGETIERLSLGAAIILVLVYLASLLFTFGPNPAAAPMHEPPGEVHGAGVRSKKSALIALLVTTAFIALLSEILVAQIEHVKQALGWSDLFLGVIVVALVGNAAEHSTAIFVARRNKMDLALNIAAGSSSQIALLIAPLLVFISWGMGTPMSLVFTAMEITGIALSVLILEMIASDGETTWFEGLELLAVYLILAVAFYYVPMNSAAGR